MAGCAMKAPVFGLRPEYPQNYRNAIVEVDSFQPALRWESFPRPHDREADKEEILNRIGSVTYDLKIWRSENDFPAAIIYSRQGLPKPYHKIENPLETCTKYFWTVRAKFQYDGQTRVTEWGITAISDAVSPYVRRSPYVPNPNLYRFKTPCTIPEKEINK